jgi:uncharacterized protein YbjT (DUF2867 family)
MARALIVGCGCRGRELGVELLGRGWQVRGTSRSEAALEAIEAAGLETALADPDRPGTILELVGDVTVAIWLLGSARGEAERIAAIHGPRLERLLEKLVDTPVRGFVYEAGGGVEDDQLAVGRAIVENAAHVWRIPVAILEGDRNEDEWAAGAADSVVGVVRAP